MTIAMATVALLDVMLVITVMAGSPVVLGVLARVAKMVGATVMGVTAAAKGMTIAQVWPPQCRAPGVIGPSGQMGVGEAWRSLLN